MVTYQILPKTVNARDITEIAEEEEELEHPILPKMVNPRDITENTKEEKSQNSLSFHFLCSRNILRGLVVFQLPKKQEIRDQTPLSLVNPHQWLKDWYSRACPARRLAI